MLGQPSSTKSFNHEAHNALYSPPNLNKNGTVCVAELWIKLSVLQGERAICSHVLTVKWIGLYHIWGGPRRKLIMGALKMFQISDMLLCFETRAP